MTPAALALSASVLMHVSWNLLARQAPAQSRPLWWALLAHLLLFAPWGWACLWQEVQASPAFVALALASAAANAFYFLGLARAYEHAPVSVVYPMVRSSPLLIALWGQWLLGQSLSAQSWLGLGVSALGLLIMAASTGGRDQGGVRRALPWALLSMFCTSVYSLTDKAATTALHSTGAVVGYISFGYLCAWLALSWRCKRITGRVLPAERLAWPLCLAGGLCIGWAYVLVIQAMRHMPAAQAVAYTNAGIVLATLAGIVAFRERQHWRPRLLGSAFIAAGLWML